MFLNPSVEPSSSLTEQAQQTADEALQATQKVAHDALKKLTDALQDLQLQTLPLAQRGMDSVRDSAHQLRLKAEHASESTVAYIKHDPVKSVLIAAATGAALMALISLVSHARHHN